MDSHTHHTDPAGAYGPEPRDADIGLVVKIGVGILLGLVACMGIAVLHFQFEQSRIPKPESTVFSQEGKLPPAPRLQVFPARELQEFKAQQSVEVDSYGWVDKEQGVARVPVGRAMEMVLKNGLPSRPEAPKQ
jgi:hypothetical protein